MKRFSAWSRDMGYPRVQAFTEEQLQHLPQFCISHFSHDYLLGPKGLEWNPHFNKHPPKVL